MQNNWSLDLMAVQYHVIPYNTMIKLLYCTNYCNILVACMCLLTCSLMSKELTDASQNVKHNHAGSEKKKNTPAS